MYTLKNLGLEEGQVVVLKGYKDDILNGRELMVTGVSYSGEDIEGHLLNIKTSQPQFTKVRIPISGRRWGE